MCALSGYFCYLDKYNNETLSSIAEGLGGLYFDYVYVRPKTRIRQISDSDMQRPNFAKVVHRAQVIRMKICSDGYMTNISGLMLPTGRGGPWPEIKA